MDEENPKEYRWETGYEKTWEAIKEDDDGLVEGSIADIINKAKRKRQAQKRTQNRLGMMRHVYVVLDCSESMSLQDLKPTRMICTAKLLELFMDEFFDQNPISQLGVITLKSKRAEKLTDFSESLRKHQKAILTLQKMQLTGEPSLQNGLDLALKTLKSIPAHTSREIIVIMASLTTCDPSDVDATIKALKKEGVRCSVISLSAEIRVFKHLAQETNGSYSAVLDDTHFRDQLMQHVDPPPATQQQEHSLIKMGFPHGQTEEGKDPQLSMCMCHLDNSDEPSKLDTLGYNCPQCCSKYCDLPIECYVCGLTLVSAPHLARSYHHLFPVTNFREIEFNHQADVCYACQKLFLDSDKHLYQCPNCLQIFCGECDLFIHDTLHICTGCTTIPVVAQSAQMRQPVAQLGQ